MPEVLAWEACGCYFYVTESPASTRLLYSFLCIFNPLYSLHIKISSTLKLWLFKTSENVPLPLGHAHYAA